jgi:hypothetical protein
VSEDDDGNTKVSQKEDIKPSTSNPSESSPSNLKEDKVMVSTQSDIAYKSHEIKPSPEEESISAKARDAGNSLKDLIISVGQKAKKITEEKTQELKAQAAQTGDQDIKKDAQNIQNLGPNIDSIINVFEDIMNDMRTQNYGEQQRLLVGYKKLLEEQINVIDASLKMAKRLKLTSVQGKP